MSDSGVFASPRERDNFIALSGRWGGRFRIFYRLPFGNTFDLSAVADATVRADLERATVSYTVCDDRGNAVLCVDFDEPGDGVSIGAAYQSDLPTSNVWSQLIRRKLEVAKAASTPYLVVGLRYFESLPTAAKASILDAILGEVVARRESGVRFAAFDPEELGLSAEEFEQLPEEERQERVQDWVIGVEVDADFEHSPIQSRLAELEQQADYPVHEYEDLFDPPLPDEPFEARADAMTNAQREGARFRVVPKSGDPVECVVWLSRFDLPYYGPSVARDIAHLLALEELVRRRAQ